MKEQSRLAATHRLFEAVLGTNPRRTRHFDQVLHALSAERRDVIVELPWSHGLRHLLRLKRLAGDRVYFSNPGKIGPCLPGTVLSDGLPRRIEADGLESA